MKDKLIFFPTAGSESDGDNVGAYVRANDGTLITQTTVSTKQALDVYIAGASGQYAEDTAHTSGDIGDFMLAVRHDANTSLVDTDGDYAPLQVDAQGRLKVATLVSIEPSDAEYAEDSAAANGDTGLMTLAVVQAALTASVSADGDYGTLKLNNRGAMWTSPVGTAADGATDSENPIKIGTQAIAGPLAALSTGQRANGISDLYRRVYVNNGANIGVLNSAVAVTTTAATLIASALGGRRTWLIQNLGNKPIYLGKDATVTAANGFKLEAGAIFSTDLGQNVAIFAIAGSGSQDVRLLEIA